MREKLLEDLLVGSAVVTQKHMISSVEGINMSCFDLLQCFTGYKYCLELFSSDLSGQKVVLT